MNMAHALKKTVVTPIARGAAISARNVGRSVAGHDKTVKEEVDKLAAQFQRASEDVRKAIRKDFMIGYVARILGLSEAEVPKLLSVPRDTLPKDQKNARVAASMAFNYRIARNGVKARGKQRAQPVRKVRLTPEVEKLADKLLAQFKGDTASEQAKLAKAALDAFVAKLDAEFAKANPKAE
jgi:hypothetical protein